MLEKEPIFASLISCNEEKVTGVFLCLRLLRSVVTILIRLRLRMLCPTGISIGGLGQKNDGRTTLLKDSKQIVAATRSSP
jgi:hypothetical protein